MRKLVAVSPYKIVLHAKVISMKKFEDDVKCLVDECEKILGDIFDLKTVKGKVKGKTTPSSRTQYSNISWYKWKFKSTFNKNNLKEKYRGKITGIHIMPYRIREVDVCNAVLKYQGKIGRKRITEEFKEKEISEKRFDEVNFKQNHCYVDYDPVSANFHKLPDFEYQVVLVHGSGPRWVEDEVGNIKYDWYFPNVNSSKKSRNDNAEKIKNLLIDVLEEILIDQAYQNVCKSIQRGVE